jgi:hypothetical protein
MHKSINKVLLFAIAILIVSCSGQKKLTKTYYGKSVAELTEEFGNPKTIFEKENEKIYVFEKVKKLRSTEINQAKLTLDPMITPSVTKTERFYFTVQEGVIVKVKMEEEYER